MFTNLAILGPHIAAAAEICNHRIIERVRLRRILNPSAWKAAMSVPTCWLITVTKYVFLVDGLEHGFYDFPFSWEFHHPN